MFQSYIKNLLKNIPKTEKPIDIDLVLDGGLFNGSYLIGSLYFLKELENKNYIKIKRISGCSVGAAIGLLYLLDSLDFSHIMNKIATNQLKRNYKIPEIKSFKEHFFNYKKMTQEEIKNILTKVNNILYISYYKRNKSSLFSKIIKQKYKSIDDLFDSILRSCFVPYLIDGNLLYKNKYVDGITPYIFDYKNKRNILYLNLCNSDKLMHMINIKNEKTDYHRILTGLLDVHLFFIKQCNTSMCSYANNWTFLYKIRNQYHKYLFEYIALFLITIIVYICDYNDHNKHFYSDETKTIINTGNDILFFIYKKILKMFI